MSLHLDQSRVLVIVLIKNALFPITTKRSWSTLRTWGTLTSTSTCITLVSRGTSWTCFTFVPTWTCWACRSFNSFDAWCSRSSTSSFITFVSSWAHGSFRSMITRWSRNTCWSRGSRASWDAWNSWCTETPTVHTGTIWWGLLRCALEAKARNGIILRQWNTVLAEWILKSMHDSTDRHRSNQWLSKPLSLFIHSIQSISNGHINIPFLNSSYPILFPSLR